MTIFLRQFQALAASEIDVMVGIHGAGLNMFLFSPSRSSIVEIHTGASHFQFNSVNVAYHTGAFYARIFQTNTKILDMKYIWKAIAKAIRSWEKINLLK